ncbi:MAG: glycosyltransferase [Flavobacteriales bacterium]|nr:glycosyltransferase [Flavobacteriales bacterium]
MFYSIVIPVFNRPDHIQEVLECLSNQTFSNFEVIIVESGSSIKSDQVVDSFKKKLDIQYHLRGNDGQGYSRNYGMSKAKGEYFVIFDSDLIIPTTYMEVVNNSLANNFLDSYGGPDKAHHSFTITQKAIDFVLTSFITTGGSRGSSNAIARFRPRSFNMGFSRVVYEATDGYLLPFLAEDLEFSIRVEKLGFESGLINDAYVYHKRKETLKGFYQQMHFFGRARINVNRFHPGNIKLMHLVPLLFLGYLYVLLITTLFYREELRFVLVPLILHSALLLGTALVILKNPVTAIIAVVASYIQLTAYALGLIKEVVNNSNPL